MKKLLSSLFAVLGLALPLSQPFAQVPCHLGDDGFDLGCCKPAHPNLPDFPEIKVQGVYACLRDCNLEDAFKVDVKLGKPQFTLCDTAVFEISVAPLTPGGPTINGKIIAKYSRTWITADGLGTQVWRFLLNGDWEYGPAIGIAACPNPPHKNPAHVVGSIDYTCDPIGPIAATRVTLNLSHLPGCIAHGPLSARPLPAAQAHNDRSYHLVAPGNFNFAAGNDISGVFKEEAVRSSPVGTSFPITYQCLSEAPVREGEMATDFKNCLCPFLTGGAWVHSKMKGAVDCGGSFTFNTVDGFDPVVPTGLAGLRLGSWVGPAYPGDVELTVYVGYLNYEDPCVPFHDVDPDRVFGVGTTNAGFLFGSAALDPEKIFVDLQDSLVQSPTFPVALKKIFGAPAFGSLVWNLNPRP